MTLHYQCGLGTMCVISPKQNTMLSHNLDAHAKAGRPVWTRLQISGLPDVVPTPDQHRLGVQSLFIPSSRAYGYTKSKSIV